MIQPRHLIDALSGSRGKDTTMNNLAPEFEEKWNDLNEACDEMDVPRGWIVCPICGAQGWRLPPHGYGEACPMAVGMYEAAGMKLDAERSTAIRMGVGMEEAMRQMRKMTGEDDDEE